MVNFNLYEMTLTGNFRRTISFEDLLKAAKEHGMFFARAEESSSEGCCCEVAIWNDDAGEWQSYAWLQCFGGEFPEAKELGPKWTASQFAFAINNACDVGPNIPVIHKMPVYNHPVAKATIWPSETQVTVGDRGMGRRQICR